MLFTQPTFLAFFGVVFAVAWAARSNDHRKLWLLLASYVFYAAWDWRFLSLILLSTLVDYVAGLALARTSEARRRRRWLAASLAANLGVLAAFKYFDFFVDSAASAFGAFGVDMPRPGLEIILPVGISFYTFQSMSYSLDIYRGRLQPTRSLTDFSLFVAFFPQLVAGPIVRARSFLPQLRERPRFEDVDFRSALTLFLRGFIKKACVADSVAPSVDAVFANPGAWSAEAAWIAVSLFAVQLYCDFSGYTDMARGLAQSLGFRLPVNFLAPNLATSFTEFWRRWHVTLSSWMRDYVYMPLGGNRHGRARAYANLLATMLVSGLWHGASWTFVLWGAAHGVAVALERALGLTRGPRSAIARIAWFGVVQVTWILSLVLFRAESFADAWQLLQALVLQSPGGDRLPLGLGLWLPVAMALQALDAPSLPSRLERVPRWGFAVGYGAAVAVALAFVPLRTQPFIYFQF